MDEAYTDSGTIIPAGWMGIAIAPDGECQLLVPKMADGDLVPGAWQAATMVAIKFMRDREWVEEMAAEFGAAKQ